MSAYDDAVAYLDSEVNHRCDYDIYIDMRDIVDEMQAENAKLREYIERKRDLQHFARLVDENSKLRNLVRELLSGYACGRGRLCDECSWDGLGDPHTFACPVRVRARELGVEVQQ